jgi:hypothetical protein
MRKSNIVIQQNRKMEEEKAGGRERKQPSRSNKSEPESSYCKDPAVFARSRSPNLLLSAGPKADQLGLNPSLLLTNCASNLIQVPRSL